MSVHKEDELVVHLTFEQAAAIVAVLQIMLTRYKFSDETCALLKSAAETIDATAVAGLTQREEMH